MCIHPLSLFVVFPTSSKQTDCKQKFFPSFIFHFKHLLEMFKFHLNFKASYFFPAEGESERRVEFQMGSLMSPVTG